jgi:hypothetical protein
MYMKNEISIYDGAPIANLVIPNAEPVVSSTGAITSSNFAGVIVNHKKN